MKNFRYLTLAAISGMVLSLTMITGCNSEEAPKTPAPKADAPKAEGEKAAPAPAPAAKPAEPKK